MRPDCRSRGARLTLGTMPRTAARLLVDCLAEQGCDRVFTVPGESFLGLIDGLDAPARARWPLDDRAETVRGAGYRFTQKPTVSA